MVDIIIEEEVPLFISAVGVPPKWVVEKFHAAGIVCANMVRICLFRSILMAAAHV